MVKEVCDFYIKGFEYGLIIGFLTFVSAYGLSFCAKLLKGLNK